MASQKCITDVTEDVFYDCLDKPKKGIDNSKAVLINVKDIDYAGSTISGATITDLVLKSGKVGFAVEWFKDLASAGGSFAPSTDNEDGFLHNFLTRLAVTSASNAERARELANGLFIMVYETKYKGVLKKEAFKVSGWGNGMKLSEMVYSTLENSGSLLYTLSTEEGDIEDYPFQIFLEGDDYDVSAATFATLFITP